jgi:hypothetical protein
MKLGRVTKHLSRSGTTMMMGTGQELLKRFPDE